jgi:predicted porin
MVYSKTRQRVALTVAAAFALAAVGVARADDTSDLKAKFETLQKQLDAVKAQLEQMQKQKEEKAAAAAAPAAPKEGAESKQAAVEKLFDKITKGFYGSMDVSGDFTTKGMGGFIAYHIPGWNGPGTPIPHIDPTNPKLANCPNPAQGAVGVNCSPFPVGNVGWMPAFSTNKSGIGYRGDHALPFEGLKVIYQVEAAFSITSSPGVTTSYTAQSNSVKAALGFGDSWLGIGSKEYGNVKVGTMYAPYKKSTDRLNPFSGQLGDYAVVMGNTGGDNRVEFGTRLEHSIVYESPKMLGGLSFDFLVSPGQNRTFDAVIQSAGSPDCSGGNIPGSGNLPANCDDGGFTSAWSLDVKYEQKDFYLTAAYERHNSVNRNSDGIGSNNPIYGYYYGLLGAGGAVPLSSNPLLLDPTVITVNGPTNGPGGAPSTMVLGAYTTDVGPEYAYKFGGQYIFPFGLKVSGMWEFLRRDIPSYLQFQNERSRDGHWLALTQRITEGSNVSVGWAHAGQTPGDPGGQHNYNPYAPRNTADMVTLAFKQKLDKQVTWYLDVAETFNHGNAHYDLGAGGRGLTTDCHDGTHASVIDYTSNGPTTWGGCKVKGASVGLNYTF